MRGRMEGKEEEEGGRWRAKGRKKRGKKNGNTPRREHILYS